MRWKAIILTSITLALPAAAAAPQPSAMQRYASLKSLGTNICFERLARGSPEAGSKVVQAGTNATDLCGCAGELFATGLISTSVDLTRLSAPGAYSDATTTALFDNLNVICIDRLRVAGSQSGR